MGSYVWILFAVLFAGPWPCCRSSHQYILGVGAVGLGYLNAAPYLGASFMAIVCMRYPPHAYAGKKLLVAVFGLGISMIVFALSTHFYLSVRNSSLVACSMGSVASFAIHFTDFIRDHMRGRGRSGKFDLQSAINELGELESARRSAIFWFYAQRLFGGIATLI